MSDDAHATDVIIDMYIVSDIAYNLYCSKTTFEATRGMYYPRAM